MAFNFELMEEELTCPVCLELYKDPLMLPCSHSLCKKCLTDILNKNEPQPASIFHCPSCRASVNIKQDDFSFLPKNLVLENIVVRYTEERNKIASRSLLLDSWTHANNGPSPRDSGSPMIPCTSSCSTPTFCELCDPSNVPSKAVLVCAQCDVTYCQSCFSKYHPRRGALSRHRIKNVSSSYKNHRSSMYIQNNLFLNKANASVTCKPSSGNNSGNLTPPLSTGMTPNCSDHKSEPSTMFCDRCKILVCHVCVCDGEGRHSSHKMLTLETATHSTVNLANHTKEQCESIISMLKDKQTKMTQFSSEIKDLHKSACSRIEQQFRRFVEDLTTAIEEEKKLTLKRMDDARGRLARRTESHRMESEKFIVQLMEVASCCTEATGIRGSGQGSAEVLGRAPLLHPVVTRFKKNKKEISLLRKRCDNLLKDKSGRLLFLSGTENFRKRVDKLLTWFLDDGLSGGDTIVPKISASPINHQPILSVSAAEAGPHVMMHRMFKQPGLIARCLTAWGADSNGITTYTGEPVQKQCSWTVTIEHNLITSSSSASYADQIFSYHQNNPTAPNSSSYLFGAGISDDPMSVRDLVGMTTSSRGIACIGGSIYFCSKVEQVQDSNPRPTCTYLSRLESLPISLTLAVKIDSPDVTVLSYKMTSLAPDGRRVLSLVGRKIIRDLLPGSKLYPVFTVSSKVKTLFPTYV